jgi:2-aminobenzoate-CoA ligase
LGRRRCGLRSKPYGPRRRPNSQASDTAADDVCLIGFTSGTTGEPKGTMHVHRDMLAICDTYGAQVLQAQATDRFIGSPPLAFTFGLGGIVLFPMHIGASTVLLEKAGPRRPASGLRAYGATVCFTAPTAYRAMLAKLEGPRHLDLAQMRLRRARRCRRAPSRPGTRRRASSSWTASARPRCCTSSSRRARTRSAPAPRAKPVPGYEARIVDEAGRDLPPGAIGRLAVRGPTGCRYLADERQRKYVQNGWNVTGDTYLMDEDGYFWYQARSDDMIVSSGYNIAGPEVEAALLTHPAVAECGVVGAPCPERGMIVKAYVVLHPGHAAGADLTRALQEHVKAEIAPYKYPRAIAYVQALPRTQTGKLQRFELRRIAAEPAATAVEVTAAPAGATAAA